MNDPSFTDQPLEFALYEGELESFRKYFGNLTLVEKDEIFSSVVHFFTLSVDGSNPVVFSFSRESQKLLEEEISNEELTKRLTLAEKKREENEKKYSESIRNPKKEKPAPETAQPEEKKSKSWSWLKI